MKQKNFDGLKASLQDALAHARGDDNNCVKVDTPAIPDVRLIRQKLNMSQNLFCRRFGFSPETLKNWEQGKRSPTGPARILLQVIQRNPQAVLNSLNHPLG